MPLASTLITLGAAVSIPFSAAFAVDCLSEPNSPAPPNSHWYYRTDRVQQHKCWYLRSDHQPEQGAVQVARDVPLVKPAQSIVAGGPYSLADFKNFMAQRGGDKLSDQDVEKLYAEFLEWRRRAKN
jgi:hypothetical protein